MPYVAYDLDRFIGKSIGSGQCVAFVEAAAIMPATYRWTQGKKVRNNVAIQPGTAIATFQHGHYLNNLFGLSHAAIYLRQTHEGIYVLDQWDHHQKRQVVHERLIHFRHGVGKPDNDGDQFYVIESRPSK
jgi:hypothetical protein